MMKDFIEHLRYRLQLPLPGHAAQFKMAHAVRQKTWVAPDDARMAGVLVLFYPRNGEWHIVLIERETSNPNDRHGGQIGFPGGKFEEPDGQLLITALREAEEEVGVNPDRVQVLGSLTELYIPVSNFLVNPFIGYTEERPQFRPQIEEVRSILEVPFSILVSPETVQKTNIRISARMILRDVPYFNIDGKVVWGATAMMMSELLEVLDAT